VEDRHIDELFLVFAVDGAGAVGGHLGQGLRVKAEGCQAPDDTGAALGIDDDDVAGALIHGGGAHAGQAGQIVLQLVRLGQRHPRLTEMQTDAPAALMQNIPFHNYSPGK